MKYKHFLPGENCFLQISDEEYFTKWHHTELMGETVTHKGSLTSLNMLLVHSKLSFSSVTVPYILPIFCTLFSFLLVCPPQKIHAARWYMSTVASHPRRPQS
jgi:hypothetical protein